MLQLYFAALLIFGVAFLVGYWFSERTEGEIIPFAGVVIIIGAIGFGTQWGRSDANFGHGIWAIMIFAPIFVSGFGFLASGLVWTYRGKVFIQRVIIGLFVIPPGVFALAVDVNRRAEILKRERFLAEMALTDIGGTFGGHNITIPVAPLIKVSTICDPPSSLSGLTCYGDFSTKLGAPHFHGYGSTDLVFNHIYVDFPRCESARCTDIKNWCERRPALKATAWCQSQNSF